MKNSISVGLSLLRLCTALVFASVATAFAADSPKLKVLILDGQNNHKWQETTPLR